jgi:2-keto-4-pentenoate hydratase
MVVQPNNARLDTAELIDRGMRTQLKRLHEALSQDVPRVGWKIGITDKKAQGRYGLNSPLIGCLAGHRAFTTGSTVSLTPNAVARAEAEISIRLDRDIAAGTALEDARSAIATLGPAIELIDISKPSGDLKVILGHSIFHEAVIFGGEFDPGVLKTVESFWPRGFRNGKGVRTPEPSLIPQDLAEIVLLVANILARYGESLKAGDRIISGSYIRPLIVEPGDVIKVEFGALGEVVVKTAS